MESYWSKRFLFKFINLVFLVSGFQVESFTTIKQSGLNLLLPPNIHSRITRNNQDLSSEAHVMKTTVKLSSSDILELTVDLKVLPSHSKNTFIMDELYLNLRNQDGRRSRQDTQDLWIKDGSTDRPVARVPLVMRKSVYQVINLGRIHANWLKSNQSSGSLIIEIKPGTITAREVVSVNPPPYVIAYTNRLNMKSVPSPVKCHSHVISVPIGASILLPRSLRTKICSPFTDITFPFNASSMFDIGRAVRKYLLQKPLPRDTPILNNPPCCHALQSGSVNFVTGTGGARLENAKITKCGCY